MLKGYDVHNESNVVRYIKKFLVVFFASKQVQVTLSIISVFDLEKHLKIPGQVI